VHPARIVKKVRREGQVQYFSWITDFVLTPDNVDAIMRGGRARRSRTRPSIRWIT